MMLYKVICIDYKTKRTKTKGIFLTEADALDYKRLLLDINRMAGYKDTYKIEERQGKIIYENEIDGNGS